MPGGDTDGERRARNLREGLIWLGFALLLGAAATTVAIPELSEDPESESTSESTPRTSDAGTSD